MRFTFYAALAASASAAYTVAQADYFGDYLNAQIEEGVLSQEEGFALAQSFVDDWEMELAETETELPAGAGAAAARRRKNKAQAGSDGIIADAKWLGGKALGAAKAVGGAIDSAYDATKGAIKSGAKAIYNAPGNAIKAAKDWKKRHNFAQGGQAAPRPVVKAK